MAVDLNNAITTIGRSASSLGQGAAEMRGLLDDTHKTMKAQDEALQSLAEAMGEVGRAQQRIGQGARTTSQTVAAAVQVLQGLADEVQGIAASLKQVSSAAQDITQVALNTRLVAFNATVEAKRAGEAGRGFAVVADAVKDLAGKVEQASKGIVNSVQQLDQRIERFRAELQAGNTGAPANKGIHAAMGAIQGDVSAMSAAALQSDALTQQLDAQTKDLQHELHRAVGDLQRAVGHADGFLTMSEDLIETIAESGVRTDDTPFIEAAQAAAREVSALLERAIADGHIERNRLFDTAYKPQPGTDPQQFLAAFSPLGERLFSPVQERLLQFSDKVVFCIVVDRNGYVPMHNKKVSQPQRSGDPLWNAANSRWRRIFNDRTGLASARNTKPFLLQTYRRDMGGGNFVVLKECAAPITVAGQHWGGVRLAFRF